MPNKQSKDTYAKQVKQGADKTTIVYNSIYSAHGQQFGKLTRTLNMCPVLQHLLEFVEVSAARSCKIHCHKIKILDVCPMTKIINKNGLDHPGKNHVSTKLNY